MNVLIDSSSLIILARLDALWLLERCFGVVGLVSSVYEETVVRGKAKGYADALRIEAAITGHALSTIRLTADESKLATTLKAASPALSRTDAETLVCAGERGLTLVIEERHGRRIARQQGIKYVTIQALPLHGLIERKLTFPECEDLLARIGAAMHTDMAIVNVLRVAAQEIAQARASQV